MLQQAQADDFVISTGIQYSVRDFVNIAANELGINILWKGEGISEKGYDAKGRCIVAIDPGYFRPTEVASLLGDSSKAREILGWSPKISFSDLVKEMVFEDLKSAERDELIKEYGYRPLDYFE